VARSCFFTVWQPSQGVGIPACVPFINDPAPANSYSIRLFFPLQLVASYLAEVTLSAFNVPVLREGNLIVLAHSTLEVAERAAASAP